MALTLTKLGTETWNTTSGTKTVTATPAVGDMIFIVTAHSGYTGSTAPTDNNTDGGGTYSLVNSALKNVSADIVQVWKRDRPIGVAASTVFTHAPGTTTGGGLVVIKSAGGNKSGAAAVVKSAASANQAAGGTPTVAMGSAISTNNAVLGVVFNTSNLTTNVTERSGFTEIVDAGYATPSSGLEVMTRNSGETGSSIAWGSTTATAYGAIVVEIDASLLPAATSLTDDFTGSTIDTGKWTVSSIYYAPNAAFTVAQNGTLSITPAAGQTGGRGLVSVNELDFVGNNGIYLRFVPTVPNVSAFAEITLTAFNTVTGNGVFARNNGSTVQFFRLVNYTPTSIASVAYNATDHGWIRIRYDSSGNQWICETAPAAEDPPSTWTSLGTVSVATYPTTAQAKQCKPSFEYDCYAAATATAVQFDGFNTATSAASVGSSAGTGAASGVGAAQSAGSGASTGTSTPLATGRSNAASAGSSTGVGAATGVGTAQALSAGTSSGSSTVTAQGGALRPGVGAATGTTTVLATGQSLAISAGTSLGTGAATGVSLDQPSAGLSAGTSTALAAGTSLAQSTGASAGISVVTAASLANAISAGSSPGTGAATATSLATAIAAGQADCTSTVAGTGQARSAATGASTGTASASAFIEGAGASVGASTGASVVTGVGSSRAAATGAATGNSTVTGAAAPIVLTTGSSAGVSVAIAAGASLATSAGSAPGSSTVTAAGMTAPATGSATGSSAVSGVGASTAIASGSSTGNSTVAGSARALFTGVALSAGFGVAVGEGQSIALGTGQASGTGAANGVGAVFFRLPPAAARNRSTAHAGRSGQTAVTPRNFASVRVAR